MPLTSQFYIFVSCIVCVLFIVFYGSYRCQHPDFTDPLTKSFFPYPLNNFFDGWGMLHLFFFTILAYFFPQHVFLIFILGLVWELIECVLKERPFYISKCASYNMINTDAEKNNKSPWWYGRWEDIVMNTCGILLGLWLNNTLVF